MRDIVTMTTRAASRKPEIGLQRRGRVDARLAAALTASGPDEATAAGCMPVWK